MGVPPMTRLRAASGGLRCELGTGRLVAAGKAVAATALVSRKEWDGMIMGMG